MGADFMFAATPRFKPTPERCREIKTFLREYPEDELIGIVYDYSILGLDDDSTPSEIRFAVYEAVLQAAEYDTRETSTLRMPGMDFEATITGGMSWGDSPTEAFDVIAGLENFVDLWELMQKFSVEDNPSKHDHRKQDIKEIDRLKRVCKDYAAIVASYQREREIREKSKKTEKSKRNRLINELALIYLKFNLDDFLEAFASDSPGMMDCSGTTMPAITEKELEDMLYILIRKT